MIKISVSGDSTMEQKEKLIFLLQQSMTNYLQQEPKDSVKLNVRKDRVKVGQ